MKKLLAISLALILLFSNIGLTMATHFCGGHAVASEISIGHKQLGCGMPDMDVHKHFEPLKGIHFKALDCCENDFQNILIEDEFNSNPIFNTISVDIVTFVVLPSFLTPFTSANKAATFPPNKPTFLLLQDTYVLNQAFLI